MKEPVKISNIILDRSAVLWLRYDETDNQKVIVRFIDGQDVIFQGDEAVEIWKEFDDEKDYKDE